MNLFRISWSNLIAKPLSVMMSLLLLAFGVSIISLLLLLNEQLEDNFNQNLKGIDMVVGAKGSPLQLILASVYHIDNPTGNIPLHEADELSKHPLVERSIPMAYGDNYEGYRILGTEQSYIDHYKGELAEGRQWEQAFEVVLGASAAERLNLQLEETFLGAHGLTDAMNVHDEHPYRVVGILKPTGTVLDQLILTGVESVWGIHDSHKEEEKITTDRENTHEHEEEEDHDHAHEGQEDDHAEESHDEHDREITALLIKFRTPMGMVMLPRMINQETSMQAALPAIEINKLLYKLLPIALNTGKGIAVAIMIISAISVFISLYNSLKDRKYELALMRSMGASQIQLFLLVVLEGVILAAVGLILGLLASRLGLTLLNSLVVDAYHYDFSSIGIISSEYWLGLATLSIGFLAAALPGIQAFSLNISETLAEG